MSPAARSAYLRITCLAVPVLARFLPADGLPLPCPLKLLTGWPCATCGMTRAWVHEAHGEWLAGLAQSPLGALLFFVSVAIGLFGLPRLSARAEALALRGALALLLFNWAYGLVTGVT